MVKKNDDAGWELQKQRPITQADIDRAIAIEERLAAREHRAEEAWFDRRHGTVMLKLTDGRVFGAETGFFPYLQDASPEQLAGLRATDEGELLWVEALDLHISVDGMVRRIIEASPLAVKRSGARLAGRTTSPAKAAASRGNGKLGGRPRKTGLTPSRW